MISVVFSETSIDIYPNISQSKNREPPGHGRTKPPSHKPGGQNDDENMGGGWIGKVEGEKEVDRKPDVKMSRGKLMCSNRKHTSFVK